MHCGRFQYMDTIGLIPPFFSYLTLKQENFTGFIPQV